MSVADEPSGYPQPGQARVRDLLRRCGRTRDRAERAALLVRVARELERAAEEIHVAGSVRCEDELAAGLRGQASMARFVADLERHDLARAAVGTA